MVVHFRDNRAMPTGTQSLPTTSLLARFGRTMHRQRRIIAVIQWSTVAFYALLLLIPPFLAIPDQSARILNHFQRFAQFLFWGVGWPLIFLSTMLFGRVWCGVFCPDGTLTEFVSRHGRKQSIPRWIRWSGWPATMLVFTTAYGQMVGVYDTHWGTLLLLGLPTLGALWCGFAYGNGKRVWCMYLCPANGPFGLLSRIAPVHFRVDETKWKQHPPPLPRMSCPTLIDIRRMTSNAACHMCGRCAGYLDAVELAGRSPDNEILNTTSKSLRTSEALTLIFGLLGVCTQAIKWSESKWFALLHAALAHSFLSALDNTTAPWWILVNHPAENRVFTLLDGLALLLFILGGGLLLGLMVLFLLKSATHIARNNNLSLQRLSLALIPIGGTGIFLGLSSFTVTHLRKEGFLLSWIPAVQMGLLALGSAFSIWFGAKLILTRRTAGEFWAFLFFIFSIALLGAIWMAKLSG